MTRTLLVLACVAFVVLLLLGMRLGWKHRAQRQAFLPPLPSVPPLGDPELTLDAVYVGTTFATSWQDRVVHEHLGVPAEATATVHREGLLIERVGAPAIFVPRSAIRGARLAPGLAGKVVGHGGVLVVRWRLGDHDLDTGLLAEDRTAYPQWVPAINGKVAAA